MEEVGAVILQTWIGPDKGHLTYHCQAVDI